jgi:hypothetical protein
MLVDADAADDSDTESAAKTMVAEEPLAEPD